MSGGMFSYRYLPPCIYTLNNLIYFWLWVRAGFSDPHFVLQDMGRKAPLNILVSCDSDATKELLIFCNPDDPCMVRIFTYIYHQKSPKNVGKHTSPMDPMGNFQHKLILGELVRLVEPIHPPTGQAATNTIIGPR